MTAAPFVIHLCQILAQSFCTSANMNILSFPYFLFLVLCCAGLTRSNSKILSIFFLIYGMIQLSLNEMILNPVIISHIKANFISFNSVCSFAKKQWFIAISKCWHVYVYVLFT
jgi:hypothetical protein